MPLTPDALDDFVEATLKRFKRKKWVDISLEHQSYAASSGMFKRNKVLERGGEQISWRVQVKNAGGAKNTGMYAVDTPVVEDVLKSANVPWTKQTNNFSYDIDEPAFQSDMEMIIDELKVREHQCMNGLAELNEENLWTAPTGTSDKRPYGIPFWIQKDATTTPGGAFNGGNPSGFSDGAGGINTSTYPRWKNWTFGYTVVTRDDFVEKLRKGAQFTNFTAPDPYPELRDGKVDHAFYTTYRVLSPLEKLLENRNDNLGADLAKYAGATLFMSHPVKWVPYLEANDTSDPIYGINWSQFRPYVKRGRDNYRHPPKPAAHQHTVREVHYDTWCNYVCLNRRVHLVGSTS